MKKEKAGVMLFLVTDGAERKESGFGVWVDRSFRPPYRLPESANLTGVIQCGRSFQ